MAINIFQGSNAKSGGKKPNSAANSVRARKAASAINLPVQQTAVSDSGNTAVKKTGTLQKVGNFIGKAATIAGKFLPGIGGTIANAVGNLLNDPEWWMKVPGEAVTTNNPLRWMSNGEFNPTNWDLLDDYRIMSPRNAFLEVISAEGVMGGSNAQYHPCMTVTLNEVTQYLMPEIRRVVNAIPLQSAEAYQQVIQANATVYAIWRTLLKWRVMLSKGHTYIASMDDPMFPLFQTANFAYLESTINRLEEYLRSSVRLPHTLCEYLAWRYGRVYRCFDSAKSNWVLYNAIPITATADEIQQVLTQVLSITTSSPELQQANTDMFNAYHEHDLAVEIRDDTQFTHDKKEFLLRTNLNVAVEGQIYFDLTQSGTQPIAIDSALDNTTVFMASTVSTYGMQDSNEQLEVLFPVDSCRAYTSQVDGLAVATNVILTVGYADSISENLLTGTWGFGPNNLTDTKWLTSTLTPVIPITSESLPLESDAADRRLLNAVFMLYLCKSFDLYNFGVYVPMIRAHRRTSDGVRVPADDSQVFVDATTIGIDTGSVTLRTIGTEHIYAFANLVEQSRKHSDSYKQAEAIVAKQTSNLIDDLDIGSAG